MTSEIPRGVGGQELGGDEGRWTAHRLGLGRGVAPLLHVSFSGSLQTPKHRPEKPGTPGLPVGPFPWSSGLKQTWLSFKRTGR